MIIRELYLKKKTPNSSQPENQATKQPFLPFQKKNHLFKTNYFCFLCSSDLYRQRTHNIFSGTLVPSQEYEGKKNIYWSDIIMSYNEFLALIPQILPYSMESEAIRIPQMLCRDRIFITYLKKSNGIKQLEFSQCLTKLLPGLFILFFNLSKAFIERQKFLIFPSATEDEGKVRTC